MRSPRRGFGWRRAAEGGPEAERVVGEAGVSSQARRQRGQVEGLLALDLQLVVIDHGIVAHHHLGHRIDLGEPLGRCVAQHQQHHAAHHAPNTCKGTVLAPVPSCCSPESPQRFSAISAADSLDEVLYDINLVEDARRLDD